MTILTSEEYESALESVLARLEADRPGVDDEALFGLMADIEAFRPTFTPGALVDDHAKESARDLVARAQGLKHRFDEARRFSQHIGTDDGLGIGPTTGV